LHTPNHLWVSVEAGNSVAADMDIPAWAPAAGSTSEDCHTQVAAVGVGSMLCSP